MYMELRVRTVCELVCHEQHYLRPEVTAFCGGFVDKDNWPRLHATSANFKNPSLHVSKSASNLANQVFIFDCLETTKDCTYCNMWHIHALSSVIRRPIRSVYPDYNQYIRPLLNRLIAPREWEEGSINPHNASLIVMWTRYQPLPSQ